MTLLAHRSGTSRAFRAALASFVVVIAMFVSFEREARAEGPVVGDGKGIVAGVLLGGEVVMLPMGIAGLKPWWPYLVFGGLGSVGGGVGGWALEQAEPPAEAPLYMLAGGLALVIPTLVATLAATTAEEADDLPEDEADPSVTEPTDPGATPGQPPAGGESTIEVKTSRAKHRKARQAVGTSVLFFRDGGLEMGVPGVEVRQMYKPDELSKFGISQQTEVHIPVVSASF